MSDLANLGFKVDTSGLKKGEKGLDTFARKGENTEKRIRRSSKGIRDDFASIRISLGSMVAAFAAVQVYRLTSGVVAYSDAWKNANSQIRQVTGSHSDQIIRTRELIALSKESRSGLEGTVHLYSELLRGTKDLGVSENRLLGVTKTLNNLFVAGGKPISEVSGAIRQLNQGFASGVLRGDEFNSVAEGAPRIMDALTKSLKISRGELREFAATGGITAEIMINAIEAYSVQAQTLADQTEQTFAQSWQNIKTNITSIVGGMTFLTKSIDDVGRSLEDFSDGVESFVTSGQLESTFGLISMQFAGILDDVEATREALRFEGMGFFSEFINEANKQLDGAFVNFPLNIRALIKIITVELASIIHIGGVIFSAFGKTIGAQLGHLPVVAKENILAFGRIIGTELANVVRKAGIVGQELLDVLNPFDGDTFDMTAQLQQAEALATGMTATYLAEADKQINASKEIRDSLISGYVDAATAEVAILGGAKDVTIDGILRERDVAISAAEGQIKLIEEQGKAYNQLEKDRLNAVGEGAGIGTTKKKTATAQQIKDLETLAKKVDSFGGSWSKTGSIIVDAFGDISDALDDYSDRMKVIATNEKELSRLRAIHGTENATVQRLQMELDNQKTSAELSNMKNIADATGSLFAEKTAAAKGFAALSKIIAIAEIALSYQKIAAGTVETAAHVANETTKTGANALTAITSAFAAPFPVGFVAGAAMVGIMAGLLGSVFGGGGGAIDPTSGRQDSQGTGSTFGDSSAKSNSIGESASRLEDIQIDQLSALLDIKSSINDLSSGITQLTKSIVADINFDNAYSGQLGKENTGFGSNLSVAVLGGIGGLVIDKLTGGLISGVLDSFSSTKKELLDSGIKFFSQTLGSILSSGQVEASVYAEIETTKKKWWGISKSTSTGIEFQDIDSSITNQMANIFGYIGDSVIGAANSLGFETVSQLQSSFVGPLQNGDLAEYRRGLEGYFSSTFSMVDVALEDALSNFIIDLPEISLEGLNGEEIQAELEAVFSQQSDLIAEYLVPSIKEYQLIGEGLFETLIRVAQEQAIFNRQIAVMGFDLSDLSDIMKIDVAQSLIQLTGGFENFSEITSSFVDNFFSDSEKLDLLGGSLTEVFSSLGLSVSANKDEFKALVQSIDITTEEGRRLVATLLEISPALSDFIDGLEDVASAAFSMLEKSVDLEKERARAILDVAASSRDLELSRIDGLRNALNVEQSIREEALSTSEAQLKSSFDAEINRIQESARAEASAVQSNADLRLSGLSAEKVAIGKVSSSLTRLVTSINGAINSTGGDLVAALAAASQGDFSKAQNLNLGSLTNLDPKSFSNKADYDIQEALNRNMIASIGDYAEDELSLAERTLNSIENQLVATKVGTAATIEAIENRSAAEVEALTAQLNDLLGIDTSSLTIDEAMLAFAAAQANLDELNYAEQTSQFDIMMANAEEVYSLFETAYIEEIDRLDSILEANEALLNAALGIDTSILSVADAIASLKGSIELLTPAPVIAAPTKNDSGINNFQRDLTDLINSIKDDKKDAKDNDISIASMQMEVVKNTKTTSKILQKLELNGISTRQIP
jgi:tape measure domain-containing protein